MDELPEPGPWRARFADWRTWLLAAAIVATALYLNLQLLGDG